MFNYANRKDLTGKTYDLVSYKLSNLSLSFNFSELIFRISVEYLVTLTTQPECGQLALTLVKVELRILVVKVPHSSTFVLLLKRPKVQI